MFDDVKLLCVESKQEVLGMVGGSNITQEFLLRKIVLFDSWPESWLVDKFHSYRVDSLCGCVYIRASVISKHFFVG